MSKYTDEKAARFDEEVCRPWHLAPVLRDPVPVDGSDSHHMTLATFKDGDVMVVRGYMEGGPDGPLVFEVLDAVGGSTWVDPSIYPAAYETLLDEWIYAGIYTPGVA